MTMKKMPPIAKVYEACSAIADERVDVKETLAYVTSSDNTKTYTVLFDEETYSSNDNATIWQHYPGYPILAVWMKQGILSVREDILPAFKNINWKQRNTAYKNKYEEVLKEFLQEVERQGYDAVLIKQTMEDLYHDLAMLSYTIKGNRQKLRKNVE